MIHPTSYIIQADILKEITPSNIEEKIKNVPDLM